MTLDHIFLILILLLIFGLIFGSVYLLPIIMTMLRSRYYGLKLNFRQCRLLAKSYCAQKDFLIGTREIWKVYPVQLDKLVSHFNAGGNLNNLKVGVSEMILRNREPDINKLSVLDLAKKDLKIEIAKAEKNNWNFGF